VHQLASKKTDVGCKSRLFSACCVLLALPMGRSPIFQTAKLLCSIRALWFDWNNFTDSRTYSSKHEFTFAWTNIGNQALVAFEIVTLKYDPFDRPMLGSRITVTGSNSASPHCRRAKVAVMVFMDTATPTRSRPLRISEAPGWQMAPCGE
jgi:hypothetical protein